MTSTVRDKVAKAIYAFFTIVPGIGYFADRLSLPATFLICGLGVLGTYLVQHIVSQSSESSKARDAAPTTGDARAIDTNFEWEKSPYQGTAIPWRRESPAYAKISQSIYRDAFKALETGRLNHPAGIEIAEIINRWVTWQYHEYVSRYPGATGDDTKQRYYVQAFECLKAGNIVVGKNDAAKAALRSLIGVIETYITDCFYTAN